MAWRTRLILPLRGHVGVEIELVEREAAGRIVRYLDPGLTFDARDVGRLEPGGVDFAVQERVDDAV